ncbi:MAG TPA: cation:proton antiporter [Burkholderiales bacterium]|nr:cation:proton antiporter [Burkholderiales bacterium]
MDAYLVLLVVFGAVVLLTAWLPLVLRDLPLSLPIACIALGALVGWSFLSPILEANPLESRLLTERLTELVIIVALMGAGLKIDRPIGLRQWGLAWRLLGIAMPLTILCIALLGWSLLGLSLASALLLGATLAPIDPVLASDVQVGPPRDRAEDEVRFALTAEAGLNDGLSFPFVYLAIALAASRETGAPFLDNWLLVDVGWRLAAGIGVGWLVGWALGYATFQLPTRAKLSQTGDGFVALGITFLSYGLTELVHGYGFVGVFVAALTLRASEREHQYHENLHAFAEQIERLLMMVLLVCFGAAIAVGSVFGGLSGPVVIVALLIVLLVRPLCGWMCLIGASPPAKEKAIIAFFGIRGLGSFYYLAFALGEREFDQPEVLWVTVCLVVLISIVLHGTMATPVMRHLDLSRRRDP